MPILREDAAARLARKASEGICMRREGDLGHHLRQRQGGRSLPGISLCTFDIAPSLSGLTQCRETASLHIIPPRLRIIL